MTSISELQQKTSDFSHVYFMAEEPQNGDYSTPDFEFPVIAGSINYSMGEVDYEYIKSVTGAIWAVKRSKGGPDISFQVATNNHAVAALFGEVTTVESIRVPEAKAGRAGVKVDMSSIKVSRGTLIFTDKEGNAEILPNCELTAMRGKDDVAYWNVKVVPGNVVIITT